MWGFALSTTLLGNLVNTVHTAMQEEEEQQQQPDSRMLLQDDDALPNADKECIVPGQRIGHVSDFRAGEGTYVRRTHIFASVVGFKQIDDSNPEVGDLFVGTNQYSVTVVHFGEG